MATMIDFAEGPQAYASLDQDLLKLALDRLANPSKYGQWNETPGGDRVWNESSFDIPTIDGNTLEAYNDGLRLNRGGRWTDHYDQSGQWKDRSLGDSAWVQWREGVVKPALMAAGAYFGAQGLEGAMGGAASSGGLTGVDAAMADLAASGGLTPASMGSAAAGGAGGLGANGAFLGEGVASGVPAWDAAAIKSAIGSGELGTAAGYAGQTMGGGTFLETLGKTLSPAATTAASTAAQAAGSGGLNMGGLLGAAAGALSSKDQTQTTNRDPWSAAQPFLKELLGQGSQLNQRYAQQPFSQAQQTAYGNMGSLLDAINSNAGGLLGAFSNSASGANQFVRGQPHRLQGGGMNMSGFAPGLLGYMGSR